MNSVQAATVRPPDPGTGFPPRGQLSRLGYALHPLTVICAVQMVLSLILALSNTAFGDEADYLWTGHLEWAHWLHGTSWPSAATERLLSGSPFIYPPLGALADSAGGLIAARSLSVIFMLGATILLYLTTARLIGKTEAWVAAALWSITEPVLRLAFATFDPLSIALMALSAWLIVQATLSRPRGELYVAAAAIALALANATAYSGLVIDPVLIGFSFAVWLPGRSVIAAALRTAYFIGVMVASFVTLMTLSHSWDGLSFTILSRAFSDHQSFDLILNDVWAYSGLILSVAVTGIVIAVRADEKQRWTLLVLLGGAALIVPAAQLRDRTGWSLDKHLAYGIWFAAIPAGYACVFLVKRLPSLGRQLTVACCVIALAYPAVNGWVSAWNVYHSWPDSSSFIAHLRPAVAQSTGLIYTSGQNVIGEYYTTQGHNWKRWTSMPLNPDNLKRDLWEEYYRSILEKSDYDVIVLFYTTSFSSSPTLPANVLLSPPGRPSPGILSLEGSNPGEPGLPALTLAIESDPAYGTQPTIGTYDSEDQNGFYAIWRKEPPI
jgi:hypothetical protein